MPKHKKIVIHKETKRVVRIKSGSVVFRRNGCAFTLTIGGKRVAESQFIDQALAPMANRDRASAIRSAMLMEYADRETLKPLFRGWPISYGTS